MVFMVWFLILILAVRSIHSNFFITIFMKQVMFVIQSTSLSLVVCKKKEIRLLMMNNNFRWVETNEPGESGRQEEEGRSLRGFIQALRVQYCSCWYLPYEPRCKCMMSISLLYWFNQNTYPCDTKNYYTKGSRMGKWH